VKDFLFIQRPLGGLADDDLRQFLAGRHTEDKSKTIHGPTWSAVLWGDGDGVDVVTSSGGTGWSGVGIAALDNRATLQTNSHDVGKSDSDVHVALRYLESGDRHAIKDLLGAFGLVLVENGGRRVTLARDAIGVAPLFYRFVGDILAISSSATALGTNCDIDREFIAEFLVDGSNPDSLTIYRGVRALPPGNVGLRSGNALEQRAFWSIWDWEVDREVTQERATHEFRALLDTAVRLNVDDNWSTWAELSGGIDSSSIVCLAEVLADSGRIRRRLDGTVSLTDELGWGDERAYSDAVVNRYKLRNLKLQSRWPFFDDAEPPPLTDVPSMSYAFYADGRRLRRELSELGCVRLLSGLGPDHYLSGTPACIADFIVKGRIGTALRTALMRSTRTRGSFWRSIYASGIFPLFSSHKRRASDRVRRLVPNWMRSRFATAYDLPSRTLLVRAYDAKWGCKATGMQEAGLTDLAKQLHPSSVFGKPAVRYPYLYRPLLEYALRLPPDLRAQPYRNKLILRRAMADDLPIMVRDRTGKGTIGARVVWALSHEALRVDQLTQNMILRELDCVSESRLRLAVGRARGGLCKNSPLLMTTLSLEWWLRVRLNHENVHGHSGKRVVEASV